jgi:hypothetical protein
MKASSPPATVGRGVHDYLCICVTCSDSNANAVKVGEIHHGVHIFLARSVIHIPESIILIRFDAHTEGAHNSQIGPGRHVALFRADS